MTEKSKPSLPTFSFPVFSANPDSEVPSPQLLSPRMSSQRPAHFRRQHRRTQAIASVKHTPHIFTTPADAPPVPPLPSKFSPKSSVDNGQPGPVDFSHLTPSTTPTSHTGQRPNLSRTISETSSCPVLEPDSPIRSRFIRYSDTFWDDADSDEEEDDAATETSSIASSQLHANAPSTLEKIMSNTSNPEQLLEEDLEEDEQEEDEDDDEFWHCAGLSRQSSMLVDQAIPENEQAFVNLESWRKLVGHTDALSLEPHTGKPPIEARRTCLL